MIIREEYNDTEYIAYYEITGYNMEENQDDYIAKELPDWVNVIKRYGKPGVELQNDDKVWELEADYISQALVNYIMVLQPQKIILGGGVMHQEQLFPLIRKKVSQMINKYLETKELANMDDYIVPCSLNDMQGILGSYIIGKEKYEEMNKNKKE